MSVAALRSAWASCSNLLTSATAYSLFARIGKRSGMSWSRCCVIRSEPGSSVCQRAVERDGALQPDRGLVEKLRARRGAKREAFEIGEQPFRLPPARLYARAAPLPGSTASCQGTPTNSG